MKIKVTTPLGVYLSSEMDCKVGDNNHIQAKRLLEGICEVGMYFTMETNTGKMFLPKEMIQKSVFELVY